MHVMRNFRELNMWESFDLRCQWYLKFQVTPETIWKPRAHWTETQISMSIICPLWATSAQAGVILPAHACGVWYHSASAGCLRLSYLSRMGHATFLEAQKLCIKPDTNARNLPQDMQKHCCLCSDILGCFFMEMSSWGLQSWPKEHLSGELCGLAMNPVLG